MNFLIPPGALIRLYGAKDENRNRIPDGTYAVIVRWELEGRVTWMPIVLIDQKVHKLEKMIGSEWEKRIDIIEMPESNYPGDTEPS